MSKEFVEEVFVTRSPSLRERLVRLADEIMAGDSYVIFPEGGVMPMREFRSSSAVVETILIENTTPTS